VKARARFETVQREHSAGSGEKPGAGLSLEEARSTAILAAARADEIDDERLRLIRQIALMRASVSWRITLPLRAVRSLSLGALPNGRPVAEAMGMARAVYQSRGLTAVVRAAVIETGMTRFLPRPVRRMLGLQSGVRAAAGPSFSVYRVPVEGSVSGLSPRFLIVADLNIPQCVKYRVEQKAEALRGLGWHVVVADWRDTADAWAELQLCTRVIFYRVAATPESLELIAQAHRLNLRPVWEVDDLVFDRAAYLDNSNLKTLGPEDYFGVLNGVEPFRKALVACGRGLASTAALARAMTDHGVHDVSVLENALDEETLSLSLQIVRTRTGTDDRVWVFYGSGSKAHDADFACAKAGLLAAMAAEERLCLRIVGPLAIGSEFDVFGDRVDHLQELWFVAYLKFLVDADIAIAPLELTRFNHCKSNIKYLEASALGVASLVSPVDAFSAAVRAGENGLIATTPDEWRDGFLTLARDPLLRARLAQAARRDVFDAYGPQGLERRVEALFGRPVAPQRDALRVMEANVFFAPRSYGGATIVAEAMAKSLKTLGAEVGVFTCREADKTEIRGNIRYVTHDVDVLSVVPRQAATVENAAIGRDMGRWIESWKPDIVHFHAIQDMGIGMLRACTRSNVPYVITLHDCWWLSDQIFLTHDDGTYHLDPSKRVRPRLASAGWSRYRDARRDIMYRGLMGAALIFSPSEEHRQLHIRNGIPADRIVVNRNGFCWPSRPRRARVPGSPVRFAYVGGPDWVKGYDLIRECMESLVDDNWELKIVDSTLNLGKSSIRASQWKVRGRINIVPAYTQDQIDHFYDDVDVLLFPSQWRESYGLTVREALSRDVWVISTAPGGQAEEIVEGVNGNLIPISKQVAPLRGAVEALLRNPAHLDGFVNPRKSHLPTYLQQAEELLSVYGRIIARHKTAEDLHTL